ncbi:MAG: hypothetical protein AAF711_15420, partial [Planctomycetota bacterium]
NLQAQFGLGMLDDETSAGYVQIHAHDPAASVYTPDMLQVVTDGSVEVIRNSRTPRQIKTDYLLVDIVTNAIDPTNVAADTYEIRYYHGSQVGAKSVTYALTGDPYRTIIVEKPSGTTDNKNVRFTEESSDGTTVTVDLVNEFVWDATGEEWALYEGLNKSSPDPTVAALRRTTKKIGVSSNTRTETMKVFEGTGTTALTHTEEVYTQYPFGWVMTSSAVDPGGINLVEIWTYYIAPGEDGYGKVKTYTSETGYWEHYVYDSDGVLSKTIMQKGNNQYDGSDISTLGTDNVVVEITEETVTIGTAPNTEDVLVVTTATTADGSVQEVDYTFYRADSDVAGDNLDEVWRVRSATGTLESGSVFVSGLIGGSNPNGHLISKTWTYKAGYSYASGTDESYEAYAEPFDVARMVSPDGQAVFYDYSADLTSVAERGYFTDPLAAPPALVYGTISTTTTDAEGNPLSSVSEKVVQGVNGGAAFVVSAMKMTNDVHGRTTKTEYFFGAQAVNVKNGTSATPAYDVDAYYGTTCCGGVEYTSRTDRAGVESRSYDDDLGRTAKSVQAFGSSSGEIESLVFYDAVGRVTSRGINSNRNDDDDLDDADDIKTVTAYDAAGRVTSVTDAEGRKSYMRYRRINTDGTAFTGTVGTDTFYWETRSYGNDADAPVSVAWRNSHGSTVRSFTGSCTAFAGAEPSGAETLTEHSRSISVYDWDNRMTEGRAYFDLAATDGPGTSYLVTGTTEYDALGRGFLSIDAAGNATKTVYEDGTGRAIKTLVGVDLDGDGIEDSELHTVSRVYYNKFSGSAPTGDDRPWPTRVYTVKPGLTAAPDDSDLDDSSPTFTDYTYTETVEEFDVTSGYMTARRSWSRPEHGPWSYGETDDQGRSAASYTTKNGNASHLLTKSTTSYYPDGASPDGDDGKPQYSDRFIVTSGSAGTTKLRSTYYYDDAGRPVKSETAGRGFTKTSYDDYGRTERTAFGSYEGSTSDATNFTADTLLTETVPTYDKSGRVTQTVTYERAHDATVTGLLSAAAADQSRASYAYTWFDDNGRQTHSATAGTDSSYTYNAGTPIEPNSSDDRLVSKVEYDGAGRAYLTTDNLGRKTLLFFDDLGRVTHRVESWDGLVDGNGDPTLDPDTPGSRSTDVNRITKHVYDNSATGGGARTETVAIDPSGDGTTTSDDQATHYIHSGEVNASERGPIPVNGRPIAVLMPDAVEDGTTRANAITEINAGGEVFGDFTYTEYFANGQVQRTTDQRGVKITSSYSAEGWLDSQQVLTASGATWTPVGDQSMIYTHGDAGETLTVSAYADDNFAQISSKLTYIYDGFYNVTEEKQDHDPASGGGTGDPKTISWAYDTTVANNIYAKAYRLDTVTYPNGRVIQLKYDGHVVDGYSIDDRIGRADSIEEDASGADIVSYRYLGSGRMVRKDYPFSGGTSGGVRLDMIDEGSEGSDANDDYEVSLDAFGRPTRYQWEQYDSNGDADGGLVHFAHAYDRNSNRLYDERKTARHTGFSKVYDRDGLDRINSSLRGILADSAGTKVVERPRLKEVYGLDALGNPTEIEFKGKDPYVRNITHNDANELGTREVY